MMRDAFLAALTSLAEKDKDAFWDYVYQAALHMINK